MKRSKKKRTTTWFPIDKSFSCVDIDRSFGEPVTRAAIASAIVFASQSHSAMRVLNGRRPPRESKINERKKNSSHWKLFWNFTTRPQKL